MKSLNSEYLQKQSITHNLLQTIRRIAEYKGKQDLYRANYYRAGNKNGDGIGCNRAFQG